MEKGLVSILIPCFNTERYLSKCLDLVLAQTYQKIEILLLNDGSTDHTLEVMQRYQEKDTRIRIINRENRGVAASRNELIQKSTGKYVTFVDSDDFISKDYVLDMLNVLQETNSDIALCHVQKIHDPLEMKESGKKEFYQYNRIQTIQKMLTVRDFYDYPVAKLLKREILEGISFPINRIYEDSATLFKVYDKIQKSVVLEKEYYFYLIGREDSITTKKYSMKHLTDNFLAIREKYDYILDHVPEVKNEATFCYVGNLVTIIQRATASQNEEVLHSEMFQQVINQLKEFSPFLEREQDTFHIISNEKLIIIQKYLK